jgi:hypothetical protein
MPINFVAPKSVEQCKTLFPNDQTLCEKKAISVCANKNENIYTLGACLAEEKKKNKASEAGGIKDAYMDCIREFSSNPNAAELCAPYHVNSKKNNNDETGGYEGFHLGGGIDVGYINIDSDEAACLPVPSGQVCRDSSSPWWFGPFIYASYNWKDYSLEGRAKLLVAELNTDEKYVDSYSINYQLLGFLRVWGDLYAGLGVSITPLSDSYVLPASYSHSPTLVGERLEVKYQISNYISCSAALDYEESPYFQDDTGSYNYTHLIGAFLACAAGY